MKYFIESSGERYLQKPDYSQIKAFRIKEVYRSLDEFKLKNPEEYAKTKEFLAPEKYLKVYEEHFRNIIYPDRLITAQDYDPVEPCYEYTLGQYLVNCVSIKYFISPLSNSTLTITTDPSNKEYKVRLPSEAPLYPICIVLYSSINLE